MVWNVISGELSWLSTPFRKVEFEFRKVRYEVKTEKKRGKICTESVFASFGDIITAAYISENEAELKKRRQLVRKIGNLCIIRSECSSLKVGLRNTIVVDA